MSDHTATIRAERDEAVKNLARAERAIEVLGEDWATEKNRVTALEAERDEWKSAASIVDPVRFRWLADWLDKYDADHEGVRGDDVQNDLRTLAAALEKLWPTRTTAEELDPAYHIK